MSLTEDWKAGKLKMGWYFTLTSTEGIIPNLWLEDKWDNFIGIVEEVLAPCDYEELQELKSENEVLKLKVKNLKDLLKECRPYISYKINQTKRVGYTPDDANLLTRINVAINESGE